MNLLTLRMLSRPDREATEFKAVRSFLLPRKHPQRYSATPSLLYAPRPSINSNPPVIPIDLLMRSANFHLVLVRHHAPQPDHSRRLTIAEVEWAHPLAFHAPCPQLEIEALVALPWSHGVTSDRSPTKPHAMQIATM